MALLLVFGTIVLRNNIFNEACFAMIDLTVIMKDPKDLSTSSLFFSRIAYQFVLSRSFSK